MSQEKKIAVIGGTGKSGKYVLKKLISSGLQVKLLIRNPDNFQIQSQFIELIKGDARNYNDIYKLLKDCKAVISTLGQPKGEPTIFSQATRNVIKAMEELNINRYILTTGLNVDTPFDRKSDKTKNLTNWMKTNFPETTFDKQDEYELLAESNISWTLIRLPMIEQTEEMKKLVVSLEDCLGDSISSSDLANFIFGQLSDETYINKSPFIGNI